MVSVQRGVAARAKRTCSIPLGSDAVAAKVYAVRRGTVASGGSVIWTLGGVRSTAGRYPVVPALAAWSAVPA